MLSNAKRDVTFLVRRKTVSTLPVHSSPLSGNPKPATGSVSPPRVRLSPTSLSPKSSHRIAPLPKHPSSTSASRRSLCLILAALCLLVYFHGYILPVGFNHNDNDLGRTATDRSLYYGRAPSSARDERFRARSLRKRSTRPAGANGAEEDWDWEEGNQARPTPVMIAEDELGRSYDLSSTFGAKTGGGQGVPDTKADGGAEADLETVKMIVVQPEDGAEKMVYVVDEVSGRYVKQGSVSRDELLEPEHASDYVPEEDDDEHAGHHHGHGHGHEEEVDEEVGDGADEEEPAGHQPEEAAVGEVVTGVHGRRLTRFERNAVSD